MNNEILPQPAQQKPAEQFGLSENEQLFNRVTDARFQEFILDENTLIHEAKESGNNYGDFFFVTVSRPGDINRIGITFYGLGYHEYRERTIKDEWFWYQSDLDEKDLETVVPKADFADQLHARVNLLPSQVDNETQSQFGILYEILADLTDEDGALAELEDLGFCVSDYLEEPDLGNPPESMALMDEDIRQSLPELYSQEEKGLEAQAKVKYFTPDSNWTWYASEFDGDDIFFGLVSGLEVELGYFSLKELLQIRGPMDLPIERDVYFEPKTLNELLKFHRQRRQNDSD